MTHIDPTKPSADGTGAKCPSYVFDTIANGQLAETWAQWMRTVPGIDNATSISGCGNTGYEGLAANQMSVINYVASEIAHWRDRGGPHSSPDRGGLIMAHSVGAGKTASMLGVARAVRHTWPECTVIIAADADVYTNLRSSLKDEAQRRFGFADRDGSKKLKQGGVRLGPSDSNEYWEPNGCSLDDLIGGPRPANDVTGAALLNVGTHIKNALVDTTVDSGRPDAVRALLPRVRGGVYDHGYNGAGPSESRSEDSFIEDDMANFIVDDDSAGARAATAPAKPPARQRRGARKLKNPSPDDVRLAVREAMGTAAPRARKAKGKAKPAARARKGNDKARSAGARSPQDDIRMAVRDALGLPREPRAERPREPVVPRQVPNTYKFATPGPQGGPVSRVAKVNNRASRARKWPSGPVVLIVDEAHLLAASRSTDASYGNYEALAMFLRDRAESSRVYRVLATATPTDRPQTASLLCEMVAPRGGNIAAVIQRVCNVALGVTPADYVAFTRYMQGCVDVYTTLGNPDVYPQLSIVDRAGYGGVAPYYSSSSSSVTFVNQVCVRPSRLGKHGAVQLATSLRLSAPEKLPELMTRALGALRSRKTAERDSAAHLVANALYHSFFDGAKIEVEGTLRSKVQAATRASADRLRQLATAGIPPAQEPSLPLWRLSPKLASFAWNLLRPTPEDAHTSAQHGFPLCKQVVVVPLGDAVLRKFNLRWLVEDVIKALDASLARCTEDGLARPDGPGCYINVGSQAQKGQLVTGSQFGSWAEFVASALRRDRDSGDTRAPFVYNAPENLHGERVPIVVLGKDSAVASYNLMAVQRVHVMALGDMATVAQGLGRVQRPKAFCGFATEEQRHRPVAVHFYAECDDGDVALRPETLRTIIDHLDHSQGVPAARVVAQAMRVAGASAGPASPGGLDAAWYQRLAPLADAAVATHARGHAGVTLEDVTLAAHLAAARDVSAISERLRTVATAMASAAQALPPTATLADVAQAASQQLSPVLFAYATDGGTRLPPDWQNQLAADVALAQSLAPASQAATASRAPGGLVSIDTALAVAQQSLYAPLIKLVECMYATSVSCVLHRDALWRYGQETGIPMRDGVPQRAVCGQVPSHTTGGHDAAHVALQAAAQTGSQPDREAAIALAGVRDRVCAAAPGAPECADLQGLAQN